jgi:poly(A) polymerase Pap1
LTDALKRVANTFACLSCIARVVPSVLRVDDARWHFRVPVSTPLWPARCVVHMITISTAG